MRSVWSESIFFTVVRRTFHCNCPVTKTKMLGYLPWQNGSKMHLLHNYIRNLSGIQMKCMRFLATKPPRSQTKENSRKPDLKQGPTVQYHELPIMFVNANYNNTMFTITDHKGQVAAQTSAGMEGFKGAKRGTNYAGQMAATAAAKKAKALGVGTLRVKMKGMGPGRNSSIKGLMAGGIEIVSITDVTPVPHNGCKPPKQRRI